MKAEEEDKRQHELEQADIERQSQPFWIGKLFVKFPIIIYLVAWIFFIIFIGLSIAFGLFTMSDQNNRDYLVWSEERVERMDMRVLATETL